NPQWKKRLDHIFDGKYPEKARECWSSGRVCSLKYERTPALAHQSHTFSSVLREPISKPGRLLSAKIIPDAFVIVDEDVEPTAEVERFHFGDKKAVPKSSLHEEVPFTRPAYRVS